MLGGNVVNKLEERESVCVCVCVYVREREREREREKGWKRAFEAAATYN